MAITEIDRLLLVSAMSSMATVLPVGFAAAAAWATAASVAIFWSLSLSARYSCYDLLPVSAEAADDSFKSSRDRSNPAIMRAA